MKKPATLTESAKGRIKWVALTSSWLTLTEELVVGHLDVLSTISSISGGATPIVLTWVLAGIALGIPLFAFVKIFEARLDNRNRQADNIVHFIAELMHWSSPVRRDAESDSELQELRRVMASKMFDYLKERGIIPSNMKVDFESDGDAALFQYLLDIHSTIEVWGRGRHNLRKIIAEIRNHRSDVEYAIDDV